MVSECGQNISSEVKMRLHLFEWEDQPWFSAPLRAAMTSYLSATYRITPFPKAWADHLSKLMQPGRVVEIVDLGSGSGGPIELVARELEKRGFKTSITLTDLYPNPSARIRYWPEPVNALRVPAELRGIRTMFAAFHHFRPEDAHAILQDAFEQRRSICIFEATSRTPAAIASCVLIPLLVLLLTPMVRALSWVQVVFTYLIPILPFLIFWDGLVSQLRTYSVTELNDLTRDLISSDYQWETGLIHVPRIPGVPYLIGRPCRQNVVDDSAEEADYKSAAGCKPAPRQRNRTSCGTSQARMSSSPQFRR
jgi:hypothetical protein